MTLEEHMRQLLGSKDFEICSLRAMVDQHKARIDELEAIAPKELKANGNLPRHIRGEAKSDSAPR